MSSREVVSDVRSFSSNLELYNSIIADIRSAKKSVHVEIYRITKETVGGLFCDALANAAKKGTRVMLLFDAWGTGSSLSFFQKIITNGGQVRAFNTIRLGTKMFTQSHRRNHRKIVTIDDKICYIGSANISYYSLSWRELTLRIEGALAKPFRHITEFDYRTYKKYAYTRKVFTRTIRFRGFEILRDVPSIHKQRVMRKYLHLIKTAQNSVYIETPYFLPGFRLRKAMADAVKRGVLVTVITPKNSDVGMVDTLRNRYLGLVYKSGVNLLFYFPTNLHSKVFIADDNTFCIGSSNFDYRSFRYMHEILLVGKHQKIKEVLLKHKEETLQNVHEFNYEFWKKRPLIEKFIEIMLIPFRYFF